MAFELFTNAWRAMFNNNSKAEAENGENLSKSDTVEQSSTSVNSTQPQIKCYVAVSSGQRNIRYRIEELLSGSMDHRFKSDSSNSKKPHAFFTIHCPIFPADSNLREIAIEGARKVSGKNTAYILAVGCSKDELNIHVAEGRLSEFIICAYNADDFFSAVVRNQAKDLSQLNSIKGKLSIDQIPARDPSPPARRI